MLGRGPLSILRQGPQGSWPDRENFITAPTKKVRESEEEVMDGQLEREYSANLQKHFSPPKRPWDFCKVSQPKRLWEFSPPFCKDVRQVDALPTRRDQDQTEQSCSSFNWIHTVSGLSNSLLPPHRFMSITENGNTDHSETERSQTASRPYVDLEVNGRRGFWSAQNETSSTVEPAQSQDHSLQSRLLHEQVTSFTKAVNDQQSKAMQLSAKVEAEIQEIEELKAKMALLCERLAWYVSHWSNGECKAGIAKALDSEEHLLWTGIEELTKVVSGAAASAESLRKQGKGFEGSYRTVAAGVENQEFQEVCRYRTHAWKIGLRTLAQAVLWYIGLMMTIVKCTDAGPYLTPT